MTDPAPEGFGALAGSNRLGSFPLRLLVDPVAAIEDDDGPNLARVCLNAIGRRLAAAGASILQFATEAQVDAI